MRQWQAFVSIERRRRKDGNRFEAIGEPFEAPDKIAADAIGRALSVRFAHTRALVSLVHDTLVPRPEAWWRK